MDEIANNIGPQGARHISDMLRENSSLLYLNINCLCFSFSYSCYLSLCLFSLSESLLKS